jgi:type IV pilus assembly protein PilY1
MKNIAKIMTFKLSVLSTLMLCVTANSYASDIEIYKAPSAADGKARIMLNLDNSSLMAGTPGGFSGGSTSITEDYGNGITCPSGNQKYNAESVSRTYNGITYTDNEYYCTTPSPVPSNASNLNKAAIERSCDLVGSTYKCYDRFTLARRSLYQVVNDIELGDRVSIGIAMYPLFGTTTVQYPLPLTAANRNILNQKIHQITPPITDIDNAKKVPVAKGYSVAARTLLTNESGGALTADQCSGYGIFSLTAGLPLHEEMDVAQTNLNSVLQSGFQITSTDCPTTGSLDDGRAWKCVARAADLLAASKAKIAMPVKSVVVSFGSSFTFTPPLPAYDSKLTTEQLIKQVTDQIPTDVNGSGADVKNNKRDAAISGIKGDGGYYTVNDTNALTATIKKFIADVAKADIPYITTGAPTIPQDPLNPALVQNDAYYSQFKPTPTSNPNDGNQLWAGNLKKYHVDTLGRLIGKGNNDVIDDLGRLVNGTHDFWAPPVSADTTIATSDETVRGSELYTRMGGVKSQLPLTSIVAGAAVVDRKLLTNRVVATGGAVSEGTTLTRIDLNYAASDPKRSDIMQLLSLRQIGAVMHSSPLLLSNEGKMTYNATTEKIESTNREDYILFGSTQGVLHVVKAPDYSETTKDGVTSNNDGGREVFAFVPHEMVEKQSKAFLTPESTTGGAANLFYGIDAPWTAYTEYVPKSDGTLTVGTGKVTTGTTTLQGKQLVYGGLRMGGRSYYALDLKDMTSPAIKFHINPDAASSGSPLSYMGESWSKPKMAWVNWNGSRKLVMFVGGGYDAGGTTGTANTGGYESDTYNQTNGIGAGVYMFDALNGDLLWWASNNASATSAATTTSGVIALKDANLKYSVASEIKTADRDNDGLVDHLYFGDLGGQVFRIDLNNKASAIGAFATRATRIMNMHNSSSGYLSPRFYAAPSFSIFKDTTGGQLFAAISIGSGNLSHPLAGYDSGRSYDALYTIYDKDVARSDLYTTSTLYTQDTSVGNSNTMLAINELTLSNRFQQSAAAMSTLVAPYASSAGWYYKLQGGTKIQNEKIFYSPTVIDYDLYVSSYDSSRLGLTGACGGGVQGVSKVQLFCMPFGQCSAADYPDRTENNYSDEHGPGIQNHAIASGGDGTTRLVGGAIIGNNLNDQYATTIKLIAQRWYEK